MADFGLFIGFGSPVRGREEGAIKVFQELLGVLGAHVQQGNVESFEPVFLQPHGGELAGFVLARGEQAKLSTLIGSPEFEKVVNRAQLIVENLGVVNCFMGNELQRQMASFLPDSADIR